MKVPTLRGAALKIRLMHPGQFTNLTQLVGFYTGVAMLVGLARPAFDRYREGPVERPACESFGR